MFVDSGDDSYIDVDLTDILSESDEEKLENLEQNLKELGNRIGAKKNPAQESSFLIDEISKAFHQKFESTP
jgi:hypothetical protein